MTSLEDLAASLPEELRVTPGKVTPEIAEAARYLADCNAMLDAGTPAGELPSVQEWRHDRG